MDHWLQGRLLLSLLMLGLTTGQADNLRYMVTYPASMSYPSDKDVCVYLLSPDADAELTVSLMTKQTTTNQSVQISKGNEQLQCLSFAVPAPTEGDKDIGTILITIVSGGTQISESNLVEIILEETGMFMQTDKPLYQPGETVRFIFAEFGDDFMTKDGNFARVTLQDSDGNKINQWNDVQPKEGIGELSCPLSPDMPLGDYTIIAEKNNLEKKTTITVDNYILPRMDIELTAPSEVSVLEKSFDMEACGKYTFNKPVKGNITLKLCRYGIFKENICQQFDGVTNTRGCYSVAVNTDTYQFNQNGYDNFMDVDVLLEEDGTGTIVTKKMTIFITTVTVKVTFPDSRSTYKSPIPFRGLMTLTGAGGSPMPNEELELYVNNLRMDDLYTTDEQGVARFTLDTITWQSRTVDIRAHYLSSPPPPDNEEVAPEYVDAYMTLMPYYTNEKSQMKIRNEPAVLLCNEEMNLFADFTLDPSEHTENSLVLYCMVFARGRIAQTSSFTYDLAQNGGLNGFFSFPVSVTSAVTPAATILLYATLSSGDMLSNTIKIPVTSCYPNQVSLQFSETQSLPGSSVSLYISAYPNSVCNIRAVDKSIELLKEEGEQPDETVDEYMKQRDAQGYPEGLEDLQSCPTGSQAVYDDSEESDMYKNLEAASIKAVTNFAIRKPLTCTTPSPSTTVLISASAPEELADMEARPHAAGSSKAFNNGVDEFSNLQSSAEIRKYFPPTWMMQSVMIGSSGKLVYPVKTPDSTTQWDVDATCAASVGLGFSETNLIVFKQLMTDVILPYSVKQGELMVVTAITNNFLKRCMMVKATLYESADFQVELCEDCQYTACLCADPSHAFTWNVRPLQLGSINITVGIKALDTTDQCDGQQPIVPEKGASDMVQRRVLVEAHGIPVEKTQSLLLCAFDSTTVPLDLPEDIVLGSQKAEVSVTGDIMGKALDNLNNLVRMPTGCGEQNMIYLAPMVAGIEYLGTTAQLTDEIMEKARSYMETGYQNLLNFKHPDGSYSAWATDASGSTWLTALVVFNLVKCERYIYVDDKHVVDGLGWLASLQQEDGCFQNVGFLYHTDLQGGQDSSTSLTAYVLQAFLEKGDPQYDDVINKAKICLEKCLEPETSTYAKALCAHTFTLTGDTDQRQQLLEQLDTVAIKTDNEKYWTNGAVPPDPQATPVTSIEVEISARCLLAYTSQQTPSQEDLGAAVPIVIWLTKHQTASGGWFSTQDTVVGLQALSAYGSHTFTPGVTPVITITDDQGFNETVEVDPGKLTEVQKRELSHIPSTYTLEASRGGCAYIQVVLWYNTEEAEADSLFSLTVDTAAVHCPPDPVPSFTISFTTSYNNENKPSNMALVMFKMVSGFVPVRESVNKLLEMEEVKKVESSPSQVTIYFNEIGSSPISGSFQVEQSSKVLDVQPAQVTVMDYYQTDQRKELSYTAPCS